MKKLLFLITTGCVLLSGCTKDRIIEGQAYNGGVTVVKATFENLNGDSVTKAAMTDEGTFNWQNGDKAAFAESTGSSYCSGTNSSTSATAVFELENKCTFTENSWALYPFDLTSDQTPASLNVKVPTLREWAEGQTNVAMYGVKKASAASFNFNHMGGLVRVRVNNVPTDAREFVFKASGYKINGVFAVVEENDFKVIKTSSSGTESEQTYTLTWDDAPAAENTMDFYIPLPVGTYSNGFAFYLKNAEHNILYQKEGSTSQPVARKELLRMPEINLTGGEIEPTAVVKTISAGYSEGDYLLPKSEKVILKIDASGSNNDITLKYDGDSHLPTNLEIQVVGNNKFDKKISGSLPFTHVDYTQGDIANVEITTSASTFNIVYPATISEKLIVMGGNVVLKGATVNAIEVDEGATADGEKPVRIEMEKFTPKGGTEQTPAVDEKIVAKADVVVASEEGVSVTVNAEGDAKIETEGEGEVIDDSSSKGGPLPGVFSVSPTKKVRFSPGNLYVKKDDSGNWNWNFYDEQYACNSLNSLCGDWGVRTPTSGDTEIDLFSWGYGDWSTNPITTSYLTRHTSEGEPFDQEEDWGSAIDDKGTWRTLTEAEWCYLFAYLYDFESEEGGFDTESPRYNLFKIEVTVCDHPNCVVLLPDDWEWGGTVGDTWQTEYNEETTVQWSSMEAAGAVCLPAAGYRRIASSAAEVREVGGCGLYWTSSTCVLPDWGLTGGYSYYLYFSRRMSSYIPASLTLGPDAAEFRNYGCSVRLVTDVK